MPTALAPAAVAFDVANHWCEWAADYHAVGREHVLDFDLMPDEGQQRLFCQAYVDALAALSSRGGPGAQLAARVLGTGSSSGCGGSDARRAAAAELLRKKALACVPLSHLKWALWGLIQQKTSDVEFNYYE